MTYLEHAAVIQARESLDGSLLAMWSNLEPEDRRDQVESWMRAAGFDDAGLDSGIDRVRGQDAAWDALKQTIKSPIA